jgi:hypothetical protein
LECRSIKQTKHIQSSNQPTKFNCRIDFGIFTDDQGRDGFSIELKILDQREIHLKKTSGSDSQNVKPQTIISTWIIPRKNINANHGNIALVAATPRWIAEIPRAKSIPIRINAIVSFI